MTGEAALFHKLALALLLFAQEGHPLVGTWYNMAASDAMLGDALGALGALRNLAAMGLIYDFAADTDFASLRNPSSLPPILKKIDDNKKPVSHSSPAFAIAGTRSDSRGHRLRPARPAGFS